MLKRSCMFLRRNVRFSLFVFCLTLIIATLLVISLLLWRSSENMEKDTLQQIGAAIHVGPDSEYNGGLDPALTDQTKSEILSIQGVVGIETMNGFSNSDALPVNFENCKLHTGYDPEDQVDVRDNAENMAIYGESVNIVGCNHVELYDYFRRGVSKIMEGEYPSENQRGAVISQELATQNNIEVGDIIDVQPYRTEYIESEVIRFAETTVQIPIVGIYSTKLYFEITAHNSMGVDVYRLSPYNTIYVDYLTGLELTGSSEETQYFDIYVDSPDHLDSVMRDLSKVSIQWDQYKAENRTEVLFSEFAGQIRKLSNTSMLILIATVIIGSVIYIIILHAANLTSSKEIGIWLSIGESNRNILIQKMMEYLIIGIAAIPVAVLIGIIVNVGLQDIITPEWVSRDAASLTSSFILGDTIFVPALKIAVYWVDIIVIFLYTFMLSLIGLLYTMYRMAKLNLRSLLIGE